MTHIDTKQSNITNTTNQNLKRLRLEKLLADMGLSKKEIDAHYIVKPKTLGTFR